MKKFFEVRTLENKRIEKAEKGKRRKRKTGKRTSRNCKKKKFN